MVLTLLFTMTTPMFATPPAQLLPNSQDYKDQLNDIVYGYLDGSVGSLANWIDDNAGNVIQDLIFDQLMQYLDLGAIASGASNLNLGSLIGGFLGDYLAGQGINTGGLDIGGIADGIIGGLLGNDIVVGILSSDFVADVIKQTILNIMDQLTLGNLSEPILRNIAEIIADEIWNDGYPTSSVSCIGFMIGNTCVGGWAQTGYWNDTDNEWVTTTVLGIPTNAIAAQVLLRGGEIAIQLGLNPDDLGNYFDIGSIFSADMILNAFKDAFLEVGEQYLRAYVEQIVDQLKDCLWNALINELNNCLDLKIPQGATKQDIIDAIHGKAHMMIHAWAADLHAKAQEWACNTIAPLAIKKLECLKAFFSLFDCFNCFDIFDCFGIVDVRDCIDELINCINTKCVVTPIYVDGSAKIVRINVTGTATKAAIDVIVDADYIVDPQGTIQTVRSTGSYQGAFGNGITVDIVVGDFTLWVTGKAIPMYNISDFHFY